jgi:hypothetical protein
MKAHHPNIILNFVPGGTTGVWQACDVGMQCSYHEDIVNTILKQIDDGTDIVRIDKKLGVLQDQSVSWLWKAQQ